MVRSWVQALIVTGLCIAIPIQAEQAKKKPAIAQQAPDKTSPDKTKIDVPLSSLTEFSATMVGSILGNIDELKIYRSGNLMRTQMLDEKSYMVTDLDKRDTWIVLPDRCAHDPRPSINTFPFSTFRPGEDIKRNLVGTEEINGHTCQVEELTITSPHGQTMKMKLWEATDLSGFPIKIEVNRSVGQPATITYKDVKIGKPVPALFKRPITCSAPPSEKKGTKPRTQGDAAEKKSKSQ